MILPMILYGYNTLYFAKTTRYLLLYTIRTTRKAHDYMCAFELIQNNVCSLLQIVSSCPLCVASAQELRLGLSESLLIISCNFFAHAFVLFTGRTFFSNPISAVSYIATRSLKNLIVTLSIIVVLINTYSLVVGAQFIFFILFCQ